MKRTFFWFVIAAQCVWIVGTVAVQESRLHSATAVHLETKPVDPRDFLRGDYVILNYEISSLPRRLFATMATNQFESGRTVFVTLEKHGQFYEAVAAAPAMPEGEKRPVISGVVEWSWSGPDSERPVQVKYGIERFYVREGTGEPRGKITVEAAVSSSGRAIIREVYLNGKPYAEVMSSESR